MATFRIPPVLRPLAGDQTQVPAAGDTLRDALEALFDIHPPLRERMVEQDGSLRRFINVYVDDEDVRTRDGVDTPLRSDSTIIVLPAMAGGCAS